MNYRQMWTAAVVLGLAMLAGTARVARADRVTAVEKPAAGANAYYPGNREPLTPSPLIRLPLTSVRPQGWLLRQLQLQADGFVGHIEEVSGSAKEPGNAWLNKDGKGHSGWEEIPYWLRGYIGMSYLLNDEKLIARAKKYVDTLIDGQRPDGYFGTEQNRGGGGRGPDLMPNMNMLYVLRSYYDATGDKRVLETMTKYFHWELTVPDNQFFNGGWGAARTSDNIDTAYWLYNRTGDAKLLELGEKLMRSGDKWMGKLTGCHNVAYSQGFRKPAIFFQQNHDQKFLAATESNYDDIYSVYGQVPGGMFAGDEFARPGHTDPQQAIETCGMVEMMFSCQILSRITGDTRWLDRCEDIAFNSFPASMTADLRGLRYLTSPNQSNSDHRTKSPVLADGGPMQVMNPYDHHCCQHNVAAGWPHFIESLWSATAGNGLAAVLYSPCELTAQVGDGTRVKIVEKTKYPFEGKIELALSTPKSVAFPLYLRVPAWCAQPAIAINGTAVNLAARGGQFVLIERTWADGDKVTIDFPQSIKIRTWTKNSNSVSVDRGPLTYSIKIGEKYVQWAADRFKDPWPALEILPTTPWNFGLVLQSDPAASFEVVQKPWPADDQPFATEKAPIELKARAKRIPNWTENYWGLIDKLQPSPVRSDAPVETVAMIPMGAGRLRLSAIPVIGEGPAAKAWPEYEDPETSFLREMDPPAAAFDGILPKNSADRSKPRFLWWAWENFGTQQWVQKKFDSERTVSKVQVYWVNEINGDCETPASWKLYYRDGKQWKEVSGASAYGTEIDKFNVVTFNPVKTRALKLEVQFKPRKAGGIHEWRIE